MSTTFSTIEGFNFTYFLQGNTAIISKIVYLPTQRAPLPTLVIPPILPGKPTKITGIMNLALFSLRTLPITSIVLPNTLSYIGKGTFSSLVSLVSVDFETNSILTSIGDYAFANCSSLQTVSFPNKLVTIGDYAFYGCNLKDIAIPSTLKSIGKYAFDNNIKTVPAVPGTDQVPGTKPIPTTYVNTIETVTFQTNSNLLSIGNYAFSSTLISSISFPQTLKSIGDFAFCSTPSLTSVNFTPTSNLLTIGNYAFSGSGLVSIELPTNLQRIGDYAFTINKSIMTQPRILLDTTEVSVTTGDGVILTDVMTGNLGPLLTVTFYQYKSKLISIGKYAFAYNSLQEFRVPASVTSIGEGAFAYCASLNTITFEPKSNLTSIGDSAFIYCPLSYGVNVESSPPQLTPSTGSVVLPAKLTTIGNRAFFGCVGIYNITFEPKSNLTSIGDNAFSGCFSAEKPLNPGVDFPAVVFPAKLTTIGDSAFANCVNLYTITFEPNSNLTSIRNYAFYNCALSTIVVLPAKLKTIGDYAFPDSTLFDVKSNLLTIGIGGLPSNVSLPSIKTLPVRELNNLPNKKAVNVIHTIPYKKSLRTLNFNFQ